MIRLLYLIASPVLGIVLNVHGYLDGGNQYNLRSLALGVSTFLVSTYRNKNIGYIDLLCRDVQLSMGKLENVAVSRIVAKWTGIPGILKTNIFHYKMM